jgi:hypothetical protein
MCETSNVTDGTPCGDGGACMGGTCIVTDLCEGVTCDDTGNDCTVGVCNSQTGVCDPMNVADGTTCNDDTGTCLAGTCEVGDQCEGVNCDDGNDCTVDGTCNPSTGECEGGGDLPINTPCDTDGFCDGAGTCVECNDGTQCPDDTNQCTMAACTTNMCGQANVMNGMACDLTGMDDGVCEDGTCVAAPVCTPATAEIDCDDGDECTLHSCPDGMCVTMPAEDGATCDADGTPGSCQGGSCAGNCDPSVVDCTDMGPNAECTEDLCDPSTSPGTCSNPPVADCTSCCDPGGGANSGNCTAGVCEAPAGPDCGDHTCTFTSATGSVINLQLAFGLLPLAANGSATVLCSGTSADAATGKCACDAEFVSVDPLTVPSIGFACLIPVPAGQCPPGDIDCDGGNDQDVDLTVDHNLNTTLSLPACTGNATCQADCATHCAGLGAVPSSAQCEGFCQLAGTACTRDVDCGAGDTCVGGEPVIHPGACQCSCLTVGDGTPDGAGDAQVFAGFGLNVLLNTDPTDVGPDGLPCTADDDPGITIPPQCAPFTTTTASTLVNNAANAPGATLPTSGVPLSTSGAPFVCGGGVPTTATGANLRTAASFLDSTLGDLAAAVELNCQ